MDCIVITGEQPSVGDGEGEGEGEPEEGEPQDRRCGCDNRKSDPYPENFRRRLGDYLLLGFSFMVLRTIMRHKNK